MKILIKKNNIKLEKTFRYFLGTLDSLPYSTVTITTSAGDVGSGEIASALDINGETQESVGALEEALNVLLKDTDEPSSYEDIEEIMGNIRLNINFSTGLMCGVEQALFDILSQSTGKNLLEILGGSTEDEKRIQTTIPYFDTIDEYKKEIDALIQNSNPDFIKFKIGRDYDLELEAMAYLREISETMSISVDANQSFADVDEAIIYANKLDKINISWAEQLLQKDDLSGWEKLHASSKLPQMVDESLHSPIDAEFFGGAKIAQYFNIKLSKCGGIIEARKILKIAKKYNIPVMLGSMLHGKEGIEYNLAFALNADIITSDFYSYFSTTETKDLGYIKNDLSFSKETLYK